MQWICDGTFNRFVVLRKWSISKGREWCKDTTDTLGIHDERTHVIRRFRIGFEIGDVVAYPFLLRVVPPNLTTLHVPRFARRITRSAVVHDTPVGGPGPGPVRVDSKTRWIVSSPSLHLRPGFSPRTGVEPVTARSRTVIAQPCKPGNLLSG